MIDDTLLTLYMALAELLMETHWKLYKSLLPVGAVHQAKKGAQNEDTASPGDEALLRAKIAELLCATGTPESRFARLIKKHALDEPEILVVAALLLERLRGRFGYGIDLHQLAKGDAEALQRLKEILSPDSHLVKKRLVHATVPRGHDNGPSFLVPERLARWLFHEKAPVRPEEPKKDAPVWQRFKNAS